MDSIKLPAKAFGVHKKPKQDVKPEVKSDVVAVDSPSKGTSVQRKVNEQVVDKQFVNGRTGV